MSPFERERASERSRVASEQRIFSLVLALVSSPQGLTKHELLSTVYGYADRYRRATSNVALERQFERDKDHLRDLGIPLETIDSPSAPGDNRLVRYRIRKQQLQLPDSVRFTARELALLRLAALAWAEGTLTAESRRSVMKIEALGAGLEVQHLGIAPQFGSTEPAMATLSRAVEDRRVVRFEYQLPGRDAPLARRVAPLRVHRAEGRWHLLARDLDRDAGRVFLLSRICGAVRVEDECYSEGLLSDVDAIIAELDALQRERRARVRSVPGTVAEARLAARASAGRSGGDPLAEHDDGGDTRIEFGALDLHELAAELAGFGEQVVVEHPDSLQQEVIALLELVAAQHDQHEPPSREVPDGS